MPRPTSGDGGGSAAEPKAKGTRKGKKKRSTRETIAALVASMGKRSYKGKYSRESATPRKASSALRQANSRTGQARKGRKYKAGRAPASKAKTDAGKAYAQFVKKGSPAKVAAYRKRQALRKLTAYHLKQNGKRLDPRHRYMSMEKRVANAAKKRAKKKAA